MHTIRPDRKRVGLFTPWVAYAAGLGLTGALLALVLIWPVLERAGATTPEIFLLPIFLAAYLGGLRPGLLTTGVAAAGCWFFVPGLGTISSGASPGMQWFVLVAAGVIGSALAEGLHRARRRAESFPVLEARLAQVAATVPGVLYSFQRYPDGRATFPYTNPAFDDLMGLDSDTARHDATHTFDRIHPEDAARVQASIAESQRQMTPWYGEFRSRHPQRGEIWIEARSVPQRMPDGSTLWSGFATDITARKRAEQKLQESEAELRALFASMNDVILVLDNRGRYLKVAPTRESNLLRPPVELLGRLVHDVMPAPDADRVLQQIARALETRKTVNYVYTLTVGGQEVWFDATVSPLSENTVFWVARDITDRRQADRALSEIQERFRRALENIPDVVVIYDRDLRIQYINPAARRVTGRPPSDFIGRRDDEVWPPEVYGAYQPLLAGALRERKAQSADLELDLPATGRRHLQITCVPLLDEKGTVREIVAVTHDLTDQRRAHADLRESRTMLRQILDTVPQSIFWKNRDSIFLGCNRNFAQEAGLASPELIAGKSDFDLTYTRADAEAYRVDDQEVMTRNAPKLHIVEQVQRADGTRMWVDTTKVPLADTQGQVYGVLGIYEDITIRKLAEEQLRLEDAALAAAANGIVITDRAGSIVWANAAFSALTGYTLEEARGNNPRLLKSGEQESSFYQRMWDTILAGRVWRGELINQRKDGTRYPEEMTITPVKDGSGAITHFIAIKQDATERKKLEAQMLRTHRLESVGRLASGIAHDLNNILTPILLAPPILREVIQDKSALSIVDSIEASAERGAAIIRQLLTFGRGASSHRVPLPLRTLMRDMLKIIQETFPKNISARMELPAELALVHGDATQLHQVLMNLCVNARDAMPAGGQLVMSLEHVMVDEAMAQANPGSHAGPHVLLSVSDNGAGIAPEHMDKIFEPFFTTKAVGEGTGLGLSTVLAIVRGHEGFLQVESHPGRGTTFRIYLPVADMPVEPPRERADQPHPRGEGELILVVDDEKQVRHVTRQILDLNGYRSVEAENGAEALALFDELHGRVRAVVTDLMMPVMDGPSLIRALRARDPELPIIAISGYLSQPELLTAVEADAQVFLSKPCSAADLLQALQKLFGRA